MDTFMDKLAQKLTAQEMIKANVAAETEELVQLRKQLAEYDACLEKFRRLVDEGAEKLRGSWANVAVEDGSGETGKRSAKKLPASWKKACRRYRSCSRMPRVWRNSERGLRTR